jgi:proteic killer suppression protein
MIQAFADKRTEVFANGQLVNEFDGIRKKAEKRCDILDAAESLADFAALPSNRLEKLQGDHKGQHSIRINRQWRVCFKWPVNINGPFDVEIVDYH